MRILVDRTSFVNDAALDHLLSFDEVEGIEIHHHVVIEEHEGNAIGIIGLAKGHHVLAGQVDQHARIAHQLVSRSAGVWDANAIARTLAFVYIANRLKVDALVTSTALAFSSKESGLLNGAVLVSPSEALAMIGAHVRLREEVPLCGKPLFLQTRTEVYPMTARAIVQNGQRWWSACVRKKDGGTALVEYAGAVFRRLGQVIQGRDALHEALRLGRRRGAILDALNHFDTILTSSVGALDALAHVAQLGFIGTSDDRDIAWQRSSWIRKLGKSAPSVAAVVDENAAMGAALRIVVRTRNSIHGIPLDEYLDVRRNANSLEVHHRPMLPPNLANALVEVAGPLGPLAAHGLFVDNGTAHVNLGQFAEQIASWSFEVVSSLQAAMVALPQFASHHEESASMNDRFERELAVRLAGIGSYPWRIATKNLEATPSYKRELAAILRRAEESGRGKRQPDR